eukprot:1158377-Pelagomonas_calceolata.AAC.10
MFPNTWSEAIVTKKRPPFTERHKQIRAKYLLGCTVVGKRLYQPARVSSLPRTKGFSWMSRKVYAAAMPENNILAVPPALDSFIPTKKDAF